MSTHCTDMLYWLTGFDCVWLHHVMSVPFADQGQRFVFFTTIGLNGPVKFLSNGSTLALSKKQRPHAPPAPRPGGAPKASWLTAALYPVTFWPHAVERGHCTQPRASTLVCGARLLTRPAATRVLREGCSADRVLFVATRVSALEFGHATVHGGGGEKKRDSGED
jgi:hypothetical protein